MYIVYYNFHSPLSSIICQKAFVKAFFTSSTLPLLAAPSESPRDRSAPKLSCEDPMAHCSRPSRHLFESHRLPCSLAKRAGLAEAVLRIKPGRFIVWSCTETEHAVIRPQVARVNPPYCVASDLVEYWIILRAAQICPAGSGTSQAVESPPEPPEVAIGGDGEPKNVQSNENKHSKFWHSIPSFFLTVNFDDCFQEKQQNFDGKARTHITQMWLYSFSIKIAIAAIGCLSPNSLGDLPFSWPRPAQSPARPPNTFHRCMAGWTPR